MTTALLLLAVLWGTDPANAQASTSKADSGTIEPQRGTIFRPVISGDWVAWAETGVGAVYAKNLKTGEVAEAAEPGRAVILEWAPWHPQVGISGDTIVWMDGKPSIQKLQQQIWSYDLKTRERKPVGPTNTQYGAEHMFPVVDGPWVAWQAHTKPEEWSVLVRNLDQGNLRVLGRGTLPLPSISDDRMVWDDRAARNRLMVTDLKTGQSRPFFTTNKDENPRAPVIAGDAAAWSMRDLSKGKNIVKIVAYRFDKDEAMVLLPHTGSPEHRANVAIADGVVIWEDWRNNTGDIERGNLDVYGYDLASGKEFPVATGPGNQHLPWISGHTAVWLDESGGKPVIGWKTIDLSAMRAEASPTAATQPAP